MTVGEAGYPFSLSARRPWVQIPSVVLFLLLVLVEAQLLMWAETFISIILNIIDKAAKLLLLIQKIKVISIFRNLQSVVAHIKMRSRKWRR